jgi:endonuclease/exonuclease/phosphatase family metal-dependent hydrolase
LVVCTRPGAKRPTRGALAANPGILDAESTTFVRVGCRDDVSSSPTGSAPFAGKPDRRTCSSPSRLAGVTTLRSMSTTEDVASSRNPNRGEVLRVITLNMGSLFEPDWPNRRIELVAWLRNLDADVVCLQEVWESDVETNTAKWIVEQFPKNHWHWAFGGPEVFVQGRGAPVRFGSAILSRRPIDRSRLDPLPIDKRSGTPEVFRMPMELFSVRTGGVDVYSTHLAPPPHQAYHRIRQVMFIDETIRARQNSNDLVGPILCGDFNAEADSDEIRFLGGLATINDTSTYYQEAWRATAQPGLGITADPRVNKLASYLNVPPKRIDYIFAADAFFRRSGAGLITHIERCFHEPRTGVYASDHFGLMAELVWPERPPLM